MTAAASGPGCNTAPSEPWNLLHNSRQQATSQNKVPDRVVLSIAFWLKSTIPPSTPTRIDPLVSTTVDYHQHSPSRTRKTSSSGCRPEGILNDRPCMLIFWRFCAQKLGVQECCTLPLYEFMYKKPLWYYHYVWHRNRLRMPMR